MASVRKRKRHSAGDRDDATDRDLTAAKVWGAYRHNGVASGAATLAEIAAPDARVDVARRVTEIMGAAIALSRHLNAIELRKATWRSLEMLRALLSTDDPALIGEDDDSTERLRCFRLALDDFSGGRGRVAVVPCEDLIDDAENLDHAIARTVAEGYRQASVLIAASKSAGYVRQRGLKARRARCSTPGCGARATADSPVFRAGRGWRCGPCLTASVTAGAKT